MKWIIAAPALLALTACVQPEPLTEYRPIVDMAKHSPARFEADLSQCRNIALRAEADYKKRQEEEMARQVVAGLLIGAIAGAAAGSHRPNQGAAILAGAAIGGAAGAASGDYTDDLVRYGPRRIVDRCMANRGYVVLNDIGRG